MRDTVRRFPLQLSARICLFALLAAFTVAVAGTPARILAQEPAATAQADTRVAADSSKAEEKPSAEEAQEHAFLHPPIVETVAKVLHMNDDLVSWLLIAINFAIIAFAIGIPLFKIVPRLMRQRTETLQADIKTARTATEDAKARLSAVEEKLAGLHLEIEKFRAQTEQEALEDQKRIKAALEEESVRIVASAEQEISAAAAQAKRGLRNFAAELAIEQATKQLVLTAETDNALIAEFVSQANAQKSGSGGKN